MLEPGKRNVSGSPRRLDDLALVALAFALVAVSFLAVAHAKIDLRDEGYLWYGSIAVTKGQVPLRDFESYDPGRYYWVAPWLMLLDRGIVPLRLACAAFHFPGILCGLLVVRRLTRAWSVLIPAGVLLTLWLFPPFMLNHTVALVGVWVAVLLIERPSAARHLLAGVFVGLAAFFGRNLGLYALVSFSALTMLVWWKIERSDLVRRCVAFGAGVVAGYSPMLLMLLFIPGFWEINVAAVRFVVGTGYTNLALPIRWPWLATSLFEAAVGVFWILCPVFYAVTGAWVVLAKKDDLVRRPVLLAAVVTGAPYLHYAFSRPDIQHLGMSIHPFLLGTLAFSFAFVGRGRLPAAALVTLIGAASLVAVVTVHPLYIRARAEPDWYVPLKLGRWTVWEPWYQARFIEGTIGFNESMVRPDEGFLIAPHIGPGLYSILNRDSPVWQLYFLVPPPEPWPRKMVEQLEQHRVDWALIHDVRPDGHEELRFRHTHPLIWEYIQREFDVFPVDGLPDDFTLYRRRNLATAPH